MKYLKSIVVDVVDEDIKLGTPCSLNYCPVARAIKRAIDASSHRVIVSSPIRIIFDTNVVFRAVPPPEVINFMRKFDFNEVVQPLSFLLVNTIAENVITKPSLELV